MRTRMAVAVGLLLATQTAIAAAQRTGDRAQLAFTISGAYISGKGLWTVPNQVVDDGSLQTDLLISRSIQSTIGAALGATYYPKDKFGLTAEAFLLGLGYDDSCQVTSSENSPTVVDVCQDINQQERSAATVALTVGGIFRIASREFISPFARAGVGLLFINQSPLLTQGVSPSAEGPVLLVIYDDEAQTRVRPAFGLGVGATMVLSRGYHLRWEVRDNIVGIDAVTGPVSPVGQIPPHETIYKHLFSVLIGIDVILERQRGRRY
jgi:opacity protein-like surface antigen